MSFFEQNLAIMRTRDPELASRMEADLDCSHIEVLPSHQPGVFTARVTLSSGEKVLLHNMEDPIGSAKRSADKQDMKAENASILLGIGLGYLARELAAKLQKKHPLIVCELDPAILKTALIHVDLSPVLNSDYIKILAGPEISLQAWIQRLAGKFMTARVEAILYEPSMRIHPEGYRRLREVAQKESRAIILNRNTTLKAGQQMLENALNNFPEVIRSAGVKHLEDLFAGRPAVLVAAGPSLEKNIQLLHELEGRAVIIAVDTALRLLLPLGIKPDIVTTIDFNPVNFQKFANVPIPEDISLVYHPGGYHESIRAFQGPKFTYSHVPIRVVSWLMDYVEDKGKMPPGTTVAHLSFHLASHLGCDPIVLVGQDLAFPEKKIHAGDLSLWRIDSDEMESTEDIFGEEVGTMTSFKHAIYHFEKLFKESRARVIDATEGGAKKQGAQVMRLREVIDEYGGLRPIDIKALLQHAGQEVAPARTEELFRELQFVSAELDLIRKDCREVLRLVRKLDDRIGRDATDDEQFVKLTCQAERLTQQLNHRERVLHLMGEQNFALELYMMQHVVVEIDSIEDEDKRIKEQVARAGFFYPSVANAAERFKKPLDQLINRLERARNLSSAPLASTATAEDWYQRARAFVKIAEGREALQAVQEALARNPDHAPALALLARLSLETNRVERALNAVDRMERLKKPTRAIDALAKEAQAQQQTWIERCARLKSEFGQKAQDRSPETAGWFYYRTKDYPRARRFFEIAVSERPSVESYAGLGRTRCELGDIAGAVEACEAGLRIDPDRADLYKELGRIAETQALNEQAEQFLREACRLEPDDAEVYEWLARLYVARGAYLEAGLCYENLLRLNPAREDLLPHIAAFYQRQIAIAATTQ
jgi:tetratricopeptide (TPR) repeat protein